MSRQCVAILGDSLALPEATPDGLGFVYYVLEALQEHGVEVQNWSAAEQSATLLATEKLDEVRLFIERVTSTGKALYVIIEVGTEDRVDLKDLLPDSLSQLADVVADAGARPIIMQVVPDDIDRDVADQRDTGFIPTPERVIEQFYKAPHHPFVPRSECHRDMARSVLAALAEEMELPLSLPDERAMASSAGNTPSHGDMLSRSSKKMMAASSQAGDFDGVWTHKTQPGLIELVQCNHLVSEDGHKTPMTIIDANSFFIEQGGHTITATLVGQELHWEDGDIWCLSQDRDIPRGRQSKTKTDSRLLLSVWEKAEEAIQCTQDERRRSNMKSERDRVEAERQDIEGARRRLEQDMQKLQSLR